MAERVVAAVHEVDAVLEARAKDWRLVSVVRWTKQERTVNSFGTGYRNEWVELRELYFERIER